MATGYLLPISTILQFFTDQGVVLAGGKVYTYVAGTTTPVATYTSSSLSVAQANPIILQSNGRMASPVWVPGGVTVKMVLQDSNGNTISGGTIDNLQGINDPSYLTAGGVGLALYPQTAAEIATSITPTYYQYPPYSWMRYGADATGVSDSTTAANNAFTAAAAAGNTQVITGYPGGLFKINGNLNIQTDKCGFDGQGAYINNSGMTSGYLWNPSNTTSDSTSRVALNQSHPLCNFHAMGPGNVSGTGFITINDTSGVNVLAGLTIECGGSWNYYLHAYFGIGSFFTTFEKWTFDTVLSGYSGTFASFPSATNSGEKNTFRDCRFGICAVAQITQSNPNADTRFEHSSLNSINPTIGTGVMVTQTAGMMSFTDCHIEGTSDAANWISLSGNNSVMTFDNLALIVDAAKTTYSIFNCASSVTTGAMVIGTTLFGTISSYSLPLVSGTGNVINKGPMTIYYSSPCPYYIASALNVLADGGFETNSFATDGWVAATTGGTAPVVSNTNPHSGTYSAKLTGQVGVTNSITLTKACKPGQVFSGQMWMAATGLTSSGATLYATLTYVNANGGSISTYSINGGSGWTTTTAYTLLPFNPSTAYIRAPAGTVNAVLSISIYGMTTGTPIGYVDDVVVNIQ